MIAGLLCIGGYLLRYWIKNRRFSRRNFAGQEQFTSFFHKTTVTIAERVVYLVGSFFVFFAIILVIWINL
jgi:hypothetical protein